MVQLTSDEGAMVVRPAEPIDIDALAILWHDGWHEAHASLVPAQLTTLRTLPSFRDRLQAELPSVRVIGPSGFPSGLCIVRDAELYQLYVSATSRRSGVASALLADAEQRLSMQGISTAWLACAIGNDRAAAFYEKHGWRRVGTMVNPAETSEGAFLLEVWRYEKRLP
jgi:ribosomal protein S18 acetylase RimI-like enzyme